MEITLHICEGKPRTVVVDKSEFVIGRAEDCDLMLAGPLVSRHHCALTIHNGGVYVRDLASSNGTGLNNQVLVGEMPLHEGDTLWVAVTAIEVHIRQRQRATERGIGLLRKLRHPIPAVTSSQVPRENLLTS